MENKGQITIFIILAIVFVVGVLIFFLVRGNFSQDENNFDSDEDYTFVKNCVEQSGEFVLKDLASRGGYFYLPDNSLEIGVGLYFSEKNFVALSKEDLEKEIAEYFFHEFNLGINGDVYVEEDEGELTEEDIEIFDEESVNVKLYENKVSFDVNYPLNISRGDKVIYFKNFKNIEVNSEFGELYNYALKISEEQKDFEGVCLSCLLNYGRENNILIDVENYGNYVLFKLKKFEEGNEFIFAGEYNE